MSNYYLCDTCGQPHFWAELEPPAIFVCEGDPWAFEPKVIADSQTPREVCPYWKPKEDA